ncbi:ABC transporter ATP-binding protein [Pedobacter heparinus]|uniref:ABC transporter related n=1 Tax=Pedobacter heparinus (strain ATCC 13125 / DSM 2366 / CIP 104194 / JCM 7457 / NBRC 12017 / NCIMB 9290 / NRRL B-14731 / HIM 762-3) TaxID=485917 RepID=C6XVL1_PEDHD|nr:ABC transporter ATP-binding protein [Pedobacter heparinus]ACU06086.1 ABC transporter related [Pedobacter heparinus DSM 2366]
MSNIVIKASDLSKAYQLGEIGTGTISRDLERWWAKLRGKEDPFLRIGETNDRNTRAKSDLVWSLKNLDFEIEQGDAIGIIGRNGAGKSTLLKILSRVTAPTSGSVKIKGRIASLLEVGTGFHPELTGRENIFLNGAILGMRKAEIKRKFDEIVDFAGVERYIDTPVKRYSSGMYVRLAFAVAAHLESEILIIDEVLAVGDAEFQKKCLGKMGDLSKGGGRTVLFVSHHMGSISGLCNKGILLSNGEILQTGSISTTIDSYLANQVQESEIPIAARKNREGIGSVRIEKIDILPAVITTFKPLVIVISFQNKTGNIKIREAGISIWTRDGFRLISISTDFTGGQGLILTNKITCTISSLPLIEGSYQLNAFISSDNGLEDYITSAKTLTVTHSDYFGSGKTVNPQWGTLAVPHSWEFNI